MNIVLYLMINTFLAFAIIICNATILGVLSFKKRDAQSIYRLSLAIADFIMGIAVVPISIGTRYKHLVQNPPFTQPRKVTGYVIANDSALPFELDDVVLNDLLSDEFLNSYVSAIAFFDILSLSVSVSSLVAASIDRCFAIFCPLRYNKLKAIFAAKITIAFVWFIALVFAILLIVTPGIDYSVHFLYSMPLGKKPMNMVYAIAFLLGVILMWSSVIATYLAARSSLKRHDGQRQIESKMRLLGTLGVMVAVFTLCVVPNAIILITRYDNMRNPADFDPGAAMRFTSVTVLSRTVLVSNSLWNCFIYNIRETNFLSATKLFYKRIARCLKLDQVWNLVSRTTTASHV